MSDIALQRAQPEPERGDNPASAFSVIIPTIWRTQNIFDLLPVLESIPQVAEILLIDNAPGPGTGERAQRLDFSKLIKLDQSENVYVNAAWNLGAQHAKCSKLCLLNDDIFFQPAAFSSLLQSYRNEYGLAGLAKSCFGQVANNCAPEFRPTGRRNCGFGCLMLLSRDQYVEIPSQFRIFCGDQFLFRSSRSRHKIINFHVHTRPRMSATSAAREFKHVKQEDKRRWKAFVREGRNRNSN